MYMFCIVVFNKQHVCLKERIEFYEAIKMVLSLLYYFLEKNTFIK